MEDLDEEEQKNKMKNDVLMVLFYIGQLVEGGFASAGPRVTGAGYDIAMDLKENGWLLESDRVQMICEKYNAEPVDGFTELIMRIQEKGLPAMVEESNKRNREN